MDTGDKLAIGAVAALAALGIAKNRRGSRSKDDPRYATYYRLKEFYGFTDDQIREGGHAIPSDGAAPKPAARKKSTRKKSTRKKSAARQTVSQQPAAIQTVSQQNKVNRLLNNMGKLSSQEREYYTERLNGLTEPQLDALSKACFAG
jgi:hypothetical protein